jgi:DNA-binding response OmpR family regulator
MSALEKTISITFRLLIVDDEPRSVEALARYFRGKGFQVLQARDGSSALAMASEAQPDAVIVDIKMPDMNGFTLCRLLKESERTAHIPVVIISGYAVDDKSVIKGFEGGADDYLIKPISPAVLFARLKSIMRRSEPRKTGTKTLQGAGIVVDYERHRVRSSGKILRLTPKEFQLLTLLMEAEGRVVTQQRLLDAVWGELPDEVRNPHTLQVHISRLRKKIGSKGAQTLTRVTGVGYQFNS